MPALLKQCSDYTATHATQWDYRYSLSSRCIRCYIKPRFAPVFRTSWTAPLAQLRVPLLVIQWLLQYILQVPQCCELLTSRCPCVRHMAGSTAADIMLLVSTGPRTTLWRIITIMLMSAEFGMGSMSAPP